MRTDGGPSDPSGPQRLRGMAPSLADAAWSATLASSPGSGEQPRERQAEAGQHVAAVEGFILFDPSHFRRRSVDLRCLLFPVDDPDQAHPGLEVFTELAFDLLGRVALAQYFDGQVGHEAGN